MGWGPSRQETHLTPCEHVLCQTAQTPTLSQWDPAARLVMGCSHYKTPCYVLKLRSMLLPWVFTGGGVSTTPQRLWPAASRTGTVEGQKKGKHLMYSVKKEQQARHTMATSPRPLWGQGPVRTTRSPRTRTSAGQSERRCSRKKERWTSPSKNTSPPREVPTGGTVEFSTLGGIPRIQDNK